METLSFPKFESFLATRDSNGEIKGPKDFPPEQRPPVKTTFWSFRLMVAFGFLMILLTLMGVVFMARGTLEKRRKFLIFMLFCIPLPYVTAQLGWLVSEIGRQPWIVYGMLETAKAVSKNLSPADVWISFLVFCAIYGVLGVVDVWLLAKVARTGPVAEPVERSKLAGKEA